MAGVIGSPVIEASPIYEQITAEVSISGSYTSGSTDYNYSYIGSRTWTRIPMVGDSSLGMYKIYDPFGPIDFNGVSETLEASVGLNVDPAEDEYLMALAPMLGMFAIPGTMFVFQYPIFRLIQDVNLENRSVIEKDAVIGTETDNSSSPPVITDIVDDIVLDDGGYNGFGVTFTNSVLPQTTPRNMYDRMRISGGPSGLESAIIDEDITLWSPAKWRDFRGTYSATSVDANGITTTLDVTLA